MHALLPLFVHTKRNDKEGDVTFCFVGINCLSNGHTEHHKTSAPLDPLPLLPISNNGRSIGRQATIPGVLQQFHGRQTPPHQNEPSNNFPGVPKERLLGCSLCKTVWIRVTSASVSVVMPTSPSLKKKKALSIKFCNGFALSLQQQTLTDQKSKLLRGFLSV